MGFDEFTITLDTPLSHIYHPGEFLVGQLHLKDSSDIDLSKGLNLTMFGYGYVHWTETHNAMNGNVSPQVSVTGQEPSFEQTLVPLNGTGSHDSQKVSVTGREEIFEETLVITATQGQTSYPFSMRIPNKPCLPWSVTSEFGKVEYGVRAEIKMPWYKLNKRAQILFTLHSRINVHTSYLGANPYYSAICSINTKDMKVGCCCIPFCCWYYFCVKERVQMTLRLHSSWANPGKSVPFTLAVDNRATSRELGKAYIKLIKIWKHIGNHGSKVKLCETCVLQEPIDIGLRAGDEITKEGSVTLPEDLIPTQVECTVLKLTYKLRVVLREISGFRCIEMPLIVEVDILVGDTDDFQ